FEGEIRQVRKAAQTVANVVTYVAVIGFSNTGGRLLPGMTANVRVVTEQREGVLKVPNAALRVRLPESALRVGTSSSWSLLPSAHAQPAPGGGFGAMRERLVSELQLSAEQQGKLDAIGAELRPRFMALRDLPEEQRGPARDRLQEEMRGKIEAMLDAEQKAKYAQLQGQAQAARAARSAQGPASSPQAAQAAPAPGPGAAAAPAPGGSGGPGGPGGPIAEFRQRLNAELQLTPEQQQKVDAIYAEARPRFMQLRDLAPEERPKARERLMADLRARVGDVLTAEQKPKYAALLAEVAGRTSSRGRIYLLGADGKPRAVNVRLGITDGTATELIVAPNAPEAAELKEGAVVITGVNAPASAPAPARPGAGPRMAF
ncbi:MAG TPA: hypothetical protein VEA40_24590, partial [Ramlibacter sp.]|nr:hypothetical protein [Ramlibacter sp.]